MFETAQWLENLARTCPTPGQLALLGIDSGSCASLLALREHPDGRLEALSNYYAGLFGPATPQPQAVAAHAEAYAAWVAACAKPVLLLHPLFVDAPFWQAFASALRAHGYWVDRYFAFANWVEPLRGQRWADYLAARPSRLRHTIERVRKKLAAMPNFRSQLLDSSCAADALEQAIADFNTVYAYSWKRPEPYPEFVPGLCRLAHRQGWLRLGLCHLDGRPVAAQIWLVHRGSAAIFKLAYDERYARYGVGTWMSAALTEHVIDVDCVHEIDFLAGDDAYKAEWMSERRERHGLIAFRRRSARGLAAAARHFGGRLLRRTLS